MAARNINIAVVAALLFALISSEQAASADCQLSFPAILSQCSQSMRVSGPQVPPSPACCGAIRAIRDVTCPCKYITPAVEKTISIAKTVHVARTCGLVVKAGMKCGSYTVPPMA